MIPFQRMRLLIAFLTVSIMIDAPAGFAYNPAVHAQIATQAANQSDLVGTNSVLSDLGLSDIGTQAFTNPEYGASIDGITAANKQATVRQLIGDGAAFEDYFPRSVNHFYDPLSNRPLTLDLNIIEKLGLGIIGYYPFTTSPDWALQDAQSRKTATQIYSVQNLNTYFYQALTSSSPQDRDTNFGLTFDTLGHVLHHVGDMTQPQHVRNDMHCDTSLCKVAGVYNPSLFETYISAQLKIRGGQLPINSYTLNPMDFTTARSYWANSSEKGLAQFTNANFVSQGTNFFVDQNGTASPNAEYPTPAPEAVTYVSVAAVFAAQNVSIPSQIQSECQAGTDSCLVKEYITAVTDKEDPTNSFVNNATSSESIFDQDLKANDKCFTVESSDDTMSPDCGLFSLNYYNFQAELPHLLSPAVAYSTGLINYIFRGRLGVQPDPAKNGNYIVTNLSSYPMSKGTLEVHYDYTDGTREKIDSATQTQFSLGAYCTSGCNDSQSITVNVSAGRGLSGQLMFVFDGTIGTEQGIAAKQFTQDQDIYTGQSVQELGYDPNYLYQMMPDGTLLNTYNLASGLLNGPFYIAVYNKTLYTELEYGIFSGSNVPELLEYSGPDYSPYGVRTAVSQDSNFEFSAGVAVNDQYLIVPGFHPSEGETTGYIRFYDHNGTLQFESGSLAHPYNISANDNHVCAVLGYQAALLDMQGKVVAQLTSVPSDNPYFINMACASTRDRHYVLQQIGAADGSSADTLYVYDDNGTPIQSVPLNPNPYQEYVFQIAATDSKIYINYAESDGTPMTVVDRILTHNPDGSVSETFQVDTGTPIPKSFGGIAVDMASLLKAPQ